MPSFGVANQQYGTIPPDTYAHFYQQRLTNYDHNYQQTSGQICKSFVQLLILALCINMFIYTLTDAIFEIIFNNFQQFYIDHTLYYAKNAVDIVYAFLISSMTTFIFFNQTSQNPLKKILAISFIVCVIANGSILLILSVEYHKGHLNSHSVNFVANLFCNHLKIFYIDNDICNVDFSFYILYTFIIYPTISLLIVLIANQICYTNKISCQLNPKNIKNGKNMPSSLLTDVRDRDGSINQAPKLVIEKRQIVENHNDNNNKLNNKPIASKLMFKYSVVFGLCWCLFNGLLFITYRLSKHYLRLLFCSLVVFCTVFKLVLKQIARKIDMVSVHVAEKVNTNYDYNFGQGSKLNTYDVSFEIFIEFTVNLIYYNFYFDKFTLELSDISDKGNANELFIEITAFHLLTEMIQSVIRLSKMYFHLTARIISSLQDCNWFGCLNFVFNIIKDDSTFDQWKTRHAIDLSLRILSLWVSFAIIVTMLFVDKVTYDSNILGSVYAYFIVSFCIDCLYFLSLFLLYYYCDEFNIWKPILIIFTSNWKVFFCIFVLGSLVLCTMF